MKSQSSLFEQPQVVEKPYVEEENFTSQAKSNLLICSQVSVVFTMALRLRRQSAIRESRRFWSPKLNHPVKTPIGPIMNVRYKGISTRSLLGG